MKASDVKKELEKYANPDKAEHSARFFKTGKGEYGEGDKFIGATVPDQKKVARKFKNLPFPEITKLLDSKVHEHRLTGTLILRSQYQAAKETALRKKIADYYVSNAKRMNNWDLVDSSAHYILGDYLVGQTDRKILYKFARSKNLWEQRISMMSCFAFIRQEDYKDALKIAEMLLDHEHDLIHKVVGWMLREIGNRDMAVEEDFLKPRYQNMPRTMLRYAIEKFPEPKRKAYLKGEI